MLIVGLAALRIDPEMQTASKWFTAWPWITLGFAAIVVFAHKEEESTTKRKEQKDGKNKEEN